MRSLGHDNARDDRPSAIPRSLPELDDALDRYSHRRCYLCEDDFALAKELLAPIRPTITELHRFIMVQDNTFDHGIFISAGYQLQPETCIVYDLDTPRLSCLGYGLRGKELIITGTLGDNVGQYMIGSIVNNGTIGIDAGRGMVGTFINNGSARRRPTIDMGVYACPDGKRIGSFALGNNNGHWNIEKKQHARFLQDIVNPEGLGLYSLRAYLFLEYERHA
jgi:hypothetical protein